MVHCVAELRMAYHQRLKDIDAAVREMIMLVEQDIPNAGAAFLDADEQAADTVEANEGIVEDFYERVEQLVISQFVRQGPVAGELRFLLTAFRILPELSGAHDWAAHLARRGVTGLAAELPERVRRLITQIFDAAADMWRQVGEVYLSGSADIADDAEKTRTTTTSTNFTPVSPPSWPQPTCADPCCWKWVWSPTCWNDLAIAQSKSPAKSNY